MTRPTNAKGKPFSWSFSAVKDYETCPFQYAHKRFYCTVPYIESEAQKWGNRVHAAAENAIKGIPHNDPDAYAQVEKYVEAILRSGWFPKAELEITLNEDMRLTTWFAKDAWFRIKIDVSAINFKKTRALMFDWKTGGTIREDEDQLRLSGAALSVHCPTLQEFNGKFIWTKFQEITGIKPFTKDDVPKIWEEFLSKVHRMTEAWRTDTFPKRPNGLCKRWCQVTQCPHCGGGMRR